MNAVMYKTQEIVSARRVYILVGAISVPDQTSRGFGRLLVSAGLRAFAVTGDRV